MTNEYKINEAIYLKKKKAGNMHQKQEPDLFCKLPKTGNPCTKCFRKQNILKEVYQIIFKKLILFFVLNPVFFYEHYYEQQKGPGTSYQ